MGDNSVDLYIDVFSRLSPLKMHLVLMGVVFVVCLGLFSLFLPVNIMMIYIII